MIGGWVKVYRSIWDNPVVSKNVNTIAIWLYLITHATHNGCNVIFHGKKRFLKPGELTTGRRIIAQKLGISEYIVERTLKEFKNAQQIEQQTDHKCRLISIVNWDKYQNCTQENEQLPHNCRTLNKNEKNEKNDIKQVSNSLLGLAENENLSFKEKVKAYTKAMETHNGYL